jgi:hypothetical protein
MSEWLWRDEASGLGVRSTAQEDDEEQLEVCMETEVIGLLDRELADELGAVLRRWARPGSAAAAEGPVSVPEGTWYQIYHQPEYTDPGGRIVALKDLGEQRWDEAYVLEATDAAEIRAQARRIGEALAEVHRARTGERYGPNVEERARAWISVFRMPDDTRVWKGYWDELDDVTDRELLELEGYGE